MFQRFSFSPFSALSSLSPPKGIFTSTADGCGPLRATEDELLYQAESPDEAALVHAARAYGVTLRGRSAAGLLVDLPGIGTLDVQLLHVLPFDPNRRRMSVVVRHPLSGQVVVYTKGADSVIMDLAQTATGTPTAPLGVLKPRNEHSVINVSVGF